MPFLIYLNHPASGLQLTIDMQIMDRDLGDSRLDTGASGKSNKNKNKIKSQKRKERKVG